MRATIGLLIVSVIAVVIGRFVSPDEPGVAKSEFGPFPIIVGPFLAALIVILNALFIVYCRRRKLWSYVGAMVLGIFLLLAQVGIGASQSSGPPAGIEAFYVVLPALVALKSYESILELRK